MCLRRWLTFIVCLPACAAMAEENVFELMWPGQVIIPGQSGMLLAEPQQGADYTWDVLLVDAGAEPGGQVVAEATLVEAARFPFRGYDPDQSVLDVAGITSMESDVIAGIFHTTSGDDLVLCGIARTVVVPSPDPGDDPIGFDALVPYALADDLGSAIAEAKTLSWLLYTPATGKPVPQPTAEPAAPSPGIEHPATMTLVGPAPDVRFHVGGEGSGGDEGPRGDRDCGKELSDCKAQAKLRYKARLKVCAGETALAVAGCITACLLTGPAYFVCMTACGAGTVGHEYLCMSGAEDDWKADLIACDTLYDQCCAENWCPPKE